MIEMLKKAKELAFSDKYLAKFFNISEKQVRTRRMELGCLAKFCRVPVSGVENAMKAAEQVIAMGCDRVTLHVPLFSVGTSRVADIYQTVLQSTAKVAELLVKEAISKRAIRKAGADEYHKAVVEAGKDNATAAVYIRR